MLTWWLSSQTCGPSAGFFFCLGGSVRLDRCCCHCINAASTALSLCIAMFITKAFNLDYPYIMYIIISVIIRVISAAVNISTSARKLFRNDLNFEFSCGLSNSCSFISRIFILFLYWIAKSRSVFGALIKLGLIPKVSRDSGKILFLGHPISWNWYA